MFEIVNGYVHIILGKLFEFSEKRHNFRNFQNKLNENQKIVLYGIEPIFYGTLFLWTILTEAYLGPCKIYFVEFSAKVFNTKILKPIVEVL